MTTAFDASDFSDLSDLTTSNRLPVRSASGSCAINSAGNW
jgi:hypothetical protein